VSTREGDRVMRQPVFCLLHAGLRGSWPTTCV
jgi:hypothetical protein